MATTEAFDGDVFDDGTFDSAEPPAVVVLNLEVTIYRALDLEVTIG